MTVVLIGLGILQVFFLFAVWAEMRRLNRSEWYRAVRTLLDKQNAPRKLRP
jgi:hypothetical protein